MQFDAVANETVAVDPVPTVAPTAPFWVGLGIVAVGASLIMVARVGARLRATQRGKPRRQVERGREHAGDNQ